LNLFSLYKNEITILFSQYSTNSVNFSIKNCTNRYFICMALRITEKIQIMNVNLDDHIPLVIYYSYINKNLFIYNRLIVIMYILSSYTLSIYSDYNLLFPCCTLFCKHYNVFLNYSFFKMNRSCFKRLRIYCHTFSYCQYVNVKPIPYKYNLRGNYIGKKWLLSIKLGHSLIKTP